MADGVGGQDSPSLSERFGIYRTSRRRCTCSFVRRSRHALARAVVLSLRVSHGSVRASQRVRGGGKPCSLTNHGSRILAHDSGDRQDTATTILWLAAVARPSGGSSTTRITQSE